MPRFSALLSALLVAPLSHAAELEPVFSTYLGGSTWEQIRDVAVDGYGNIYTVGGTDSTDFPRTLGSPHAGSVDVFITKLSPTGTLIWSRLLGGPNYDRAYAVRVDSQDNIIITGRSGRGFPTTPNTAQPAFNGYYTGSAYGEQNPFVAKLRPDGGLVWATYFGSGDLIRDMDIDDAGDIYVGSNYAPLLPQAPFPAAWFAHAYQATPQGGTDLVVAKMKSDGSQVLWATFLGGSANENPKVSVRVDASRNVFVFTNTVSNNAPVPNGHQTVNHGGNTGDFYLAKLSSGGDSLVWATYFGGSGDELCETHHLVLDSHGDVYLGALTTSTDYPTTAGVLQRSYGGAGIRHFHAGGDAAIAKFSSAGQLLASTYFGGNNGDEIQGVGVDGQGNFYFGGGTVSSGLPVTADALQPAKKAGEDFMAFKLSADFSHVLYGTYLGTSTDTTNADEGRTAYVDVQGNFYVGGEVAGTNFPVLNDFQPTYGGGLGDTALVMFRAGSVDGSPDGGLFPDAGAGLPPAGSTPGVPGVPTPDAGTGADGSSDPTMASGGCSAAQGPLGSVVAAAWVWTLAWRGRPHRRKFVSA